MKAVVLDVTKHEKCVICRNWHDPADEALRPVSPRTGKWECDAGEKRMCRARNVEMPANGLCRHFQKKDI